MKENNSYLNIIKKLVNLDDINKPNKYKLGFPRYVTLIKYQDCILKFIDKTTAKLIKRSTMSNLNSGVFGIEGKIYSDYIEIDYISSYELEPRFWIPVPEIKIKKELRRGLAFYKESGLPWTAEEYVNCVRYSGEPLLYKNSDTTFDNLHEKVNHYDNDLYRKYIYDDNSNGHTFMHFWSYSNDDEGSFVERKKNLNILIYEEVFCNCDNIVWID